MRFSPWIACALIALFALPAFAAGESKEKAPTDGSFVVYDDGFRDASGADNNDNVVDITTGGKVSWGYFQGDKVHDVIWLSGRPSSCNPPLPASAEPPGWDATCTFNQPGEYDFFCEVHPYMTGKVEVTGTATPSPSPSPTATATPSVTASPTPTVTATATPTGGAHNSAHDRGALNWWQDASSTSETDSSVTIDAGASVTFDFPTGAGASVHNLTFPTDPKPISCTLTKGSAPNPSGGPPIPLYASPAGWEGSCRFENPGTYSFVCGVHPEMKGTVIVQGVATPTPTPTATATTTATAAPTTSATAVPTASATPIVPAATNAPAAPAATPTVAPAGVQRAAAKPKLSASLSRKRRTVVFSGTIAAKSGTVKITLSYRNAKKRTVEKTVSAKIAKGKFSAKLKLSATDAKKATKLSATLTYAGDAAFLPATRKATPKVKK